MAHSRLVSNAGILGSACTLALALAPTSALATSSVPQAITVGTLALKVCDAEFDGYCGSIKRAFDSTGGVKGNINIGFIYYPRFDRAHPALGTLLPQEGGPGYSTRGTAGAYLDIYGSLRERRDVLIIDKRGSGQSGAVNCHAIQTGDPVDPEGLKDCGRQLGNLARAMVDVTVRGRGEHGGVVLENRDIRTLVDA